MPLLLGASSAAMAAGGPGWWHDHWAIQGQFNATHQSNKVHNNVRPIQVNVGSDDNIQDTHVHNNLLNANDTLQAQSAR
ncbi:hypothetical protein HUO13_29165 [Saccharopolyspora erythraea]|nr:hypothetical protein HUO13_29165 [Saccharopolyspora erythraea]